MTTPYFLSIAPAAIRQINELNMKQRLTIFKLLEALSVNPRPPGVKKIDGMTGLHAQSIEGLKLIYKVEEQEIILLIVKFL